MNVKPLKKHLNVSNDSEHFREFDNSLNWKEVDDPHVWEEFKSGSDAAFVYIYNAYFSKLLNMGYQLTQDKFLIKDCIQDLFIDLINRRSNLGDVKSIKLYLYKCFRRKIIKYIQFTRRNHLKENDAGRQTYCIEISQEERLMNIQLVEYQRRKITKGMDILTDKEREAIYYFYYQNLSYSEICELFNYTQVKTVRSLVYQALKKLRSCF